jgi:hypothetical protein
MENFSQKTTRSQPLLHGLAHDTVKIRWISLPKFCTFAITEFQGYGIPP